MTAIDPAESSASLLPSPQPVPLEVLPGLFRHGVVQVICRRPPDFPVGPELPGRIRGAWGRQLMEGASVEALAGRPCPWRPACAHWVFFGDHGRIGPGLDLPKPYVLAAAPLGDTELVVALTLFGLAADWIEPAADAMVRALRNGISGEAHQGGRRPGLEPLSRSLMEVAGIAAPESGQRAVLSFDSPLSLRSGDTLKTDLSTLPMTLGNRVGGLARWLGLCIDADWRDLRDQSQALTVDASAMTERRWNRRSDRQGKLIPMRGLEGELVLTGPLAPVLPLLALGAITHAGSHAAIGQGRYRLRVE